MNIFALTKVKTARNYMVRNTNVDYPAKNGIFKMSLSVILNTNFSMLPNGKLPNEARLIFFNENRR